MAPLLLVCLSGITAAGHSQTPSSPATVEASPAKPATTAAAQGGSISGTVKSGAIPLPGVAVTATNTLTGKKYATTTDITGAFSMSVPKNGRYVIRAELAAFASVTQEVLINAESLNGGKPTQVADLGMQLASRQAAEETQSATVSGAIARGLQSLNVQRGALDTADASSGTGNAGAALPSAAAGDAAGSDSVTVSGAVGQTNGLAGVSEDDIRQRIQDAMQQAQRQGGANGDVINAVAGMLGGIMAGGPGGFGGGPGGGGGRGGRGGGGGFRNFNPSQPHGTIYYQGAYNGLNAIPYSLTGAPTPNLGGAQNSFGITFSGSPSIPHVMKGSSKQFFFVSVTGQRNITPQNLYGTVPTAAEQAGDFSGLTQTSGGTTVPVQLYFPAGTPNAGMPIPNNNLVQAGLALSPVATNILAKYYPTPNITNTGTQNYNYQTITNAGSNRDTASLRYVRNFGQNASNPFGGFGGGGGGGRRNGGNSNAKPTLSQNINFNGSYSHSASDSRNIFLPFGGSSSSDSYGVTAGYTISYGRLRNNASLNWNRSHAFSTNYFTNKATDPIDDVGLSIPKPVIGADPGIYYGLPSLSFTGFTGISTPTPSDKVNQTISFSDFVAWNHKKHNMRFGFDIRRVHADSIGGTNALGTLTFSGYATQCVANPTATPPIICPTESGSGFADFLLGLPQQSKIQASAFKTYLRANVFDWYAQDDWRALPSLTLNLGLRYEYFSPYVEKFDHLVNLDHNAGFTAVAAVLPSQKGSYSGNFPRSLVNPDRNLYSPRLGFAYRAPETFLPALTKQMVIRGGYGINFNTGQYATIASQLASQPSPAGTQPAFAITQTNIANSQGCPVLQLDQKPGAELFSCSNATVQNNFSANKDYRLGHVQVWNVDIQKTLPLQIVANIGYNGSKGGGLDILRAPNRTATGLLNPDVAAFNYEDSLGYSRFNGLSINVRKRMQKGISVQASYLYGHSIDDASSIGGSGSVVAQDPNHLRAEEANSSFDIRHQVSGNWVFELPFGPNRAFLAAGGFWSKTLDGWSVSGNYAFQTGSFYTPNFVDSVQEIATGVSGSERANRNFAVPISGSKTFSSWFNPAAFSKPADGTYGNASRNSIEGPGVVSINSSLSRTLQLGSTRSFETRLQANNVFNTIQYSGINTTLNSPTFGQVSSVASTRSLTFIARYRF
jgi:trimeric autotransporter adhesin